MTALRALGRRAAGGYLAPAPPERPAALRILVGAYAVTLTAILGPEYLDLADRNPARFEPLGVVSLLDRPLPGAAVPALLALTLALGGAFTLGWRFRLTGPAFAAAFLALATYRHAWGQVFHTENLVVLHVAVLACAPAAHAWSLDARAGRAPRSPADLPVAGYGWPARLMMGLTVAAYVLAGIAKLRLGGWAWLDGDVLRHQVAFDNLRKVVVGDTYSPFVTGALDHAWLFGPAAWFTLAVELGAPLALLAGWPRRVWVGAAWLFHAGILALMAIVFAYPLSGIAFACFFPVERAAARLAVRRRAAGQPAGSTTPLSATARSISS